MTPSLKRALEAYGDDPGPMLPDETVNQYMVRGMQHFFGRSFLEDQNEEAVRRRIGRGDFRYAVKLMKAWYRRAPEEVDVLRILKAELLQERARRRIILAGYARTYRRNRRAKRMAADTRSCQMCGGSMSHTRAKAQVCSPKCRVRKCRGKISHSLSQR
jgi:hypothetical protein